MRKDEPEKDHTKKNEPYFKPSLRGALLQGIVRRYPMLDAATIEVITQVQSLARTLSAQLNCDLSDYGLTEGKFYVLAYLFSEELSGHDAPSPSDIAENLGVTRGTITGLLDGLEREDYVERRHDSHDRRALTIHMAEKARRLFDSFLPKKAAALSRAMPLSEEEKHTLTEWLSRIEQAMHEAGV